MLGKGGHDAAPHHIPDAPVLRAAQVAAHLLQGPLGGQTGLDGLLDLPQLPGGALLLLGQLAQPLGLGASLAVQGLLFLIQQGLVLLLQPPQALLLPHCVPEPPVQVLQVPLGRVVPGLGHGGLPALLRLPALQIPLDSGQEGHQGHAL